MRRIATSASLVSLVTLLSLAIAAPASAGSGTGLPQGSCTNGTSCQVELQNIVTFNGSYSNKTSNSVDISTPPCIWDPVGDATAGSLYVLHFFGQSSLSNYAMMEHQIFAQAETLLKTPKPGEWYESTINPAAGPAADAACNNLPPFSFVLTPKQLPYVKLPPATLAQLAFAVLVTPQVRKIILDPAIANGIAKTEVSLPTFVQVTLGAPPRGRIGLTNDGHAWVGVTASLGGQSATVWAESSSLVINPGTQEATDATVYDGADCSTATVAGGGFTLGSKASPAAMAATTANQPIDCGVIYRVPSAGTLTLQASIGWTACWADTGGAVTPPRAPDFANCQNNPVPGAGNLTSSTAQQAIAVQEVQSVNRG